MANYARLAELLNQHFSRRQLSITQLATQVGVAPSTVSRWLMGQTRPGTEDLVLNIADALEIQDASAREALLIAAGYDNFINVPRINSRLTTAATPDQETALEQPTSSAETGTHDNPLVNWLNRTIADLSRQVENDARWERIILALLRAPIERASGPGVPILFVSLALWILTFLLTAPLQWGQLDHQPTRFVACLQYGLATLLIPILVALLVRPVWESSFQPATVKQTMKVLLLKLAGALVGFYIVSILPVLLTLLLLAPHGVTLSVWVTWPMAGAALALSYIGARCIPVDRYKPSEQDVELLPVDYLVLVTFGLIGPATALAVYHVHALLSEQPTGLALVIALMAIALWEYKKQRPSELSDPG